MGTARQLLTIEDWLALSDDARAELVEGQFVYKALPSAEHSFSLADLGAVLGPFHRSRNVEGELGGWCIGSIAPVIYPGRQNGFIHDLAGWRRDRHRERPSGPRVTARPDWVCEIVSSNRNDAYVLKRRVLHEHRVEYYWLLDHRDKLLTAMKWVEGGYLNFAEATVGEMVRMEPFEAVEIDVGLLFGVEREM